MIITNAPHYFWASWGDQDSRERRLNGTGQKWWSTIKVCQWVLRSLLSIVWSKAVVLVGCYHLTHWGRVTHICVGNLTIIGPDNGLSPGRRQAITWTNDGKLLIGTLGTNFSEILIEIPTFLSKKMRLKVSSAIWRPSCLGLNVLIGVQCI